MDSARDLYLEVVMVAVRHYASKDDTDEEFNSQLNEIATKMETLYYNTRPTEVFQKNPNIGKEEFLRTVMVDFAQQTRDLITVPMYNSSFGTKWFKPHMSLDDFTHIFMKEFKKDFDKNLEKKWDDYQLLQ